nr:Ig-like domain-containing protein [Vibrio parahaemolyticus]
MQNYTANSIEVSGFDLIITDGNGQKQTIKDGLSSFFMGDIQLLSPSGEPYTHQQVVDSLSGLALGLDSAFFDDLIKSESSVDAPQEDKEDLAKAVEQEEAIAQLQAQLELYQELIKEAQQKAQEETKDQIEEVEQPKEIKDSKVAQQLSQQLRPGEQVVDASAEQTEVKPASSSSDAASSGSSDVIPNENKGESDSLLFISGALDQASDTGPKGDAITSVQKPIFSGMATPTGVAVLIINGKSYDLTIDAKGAWSFELPDGLADGSYSYELRVTDPKTGEVSSVTQNVTIDTTASFINAGLAEGSDTGASVTDGITNQNIPTLTGKCEPNSTVKIQFGEQIWTVQADNQGSWRQTLSEKLEDGEYSYTVTVVDVAGNESTETFTFKVDTSIDLSATIQNAFNGSTPSSFLTNDSKPDFAGSSEPGSIITLTINNNTYQTIVGKDGNWAISLPGSLADGNYNYVITATDAAGNQAQSSGSVDIKTKAPTIELSLENDSGDKKDWITNESSPSLSIKTEADALVVVTINGVRYEATANDDGIALFENIHSISDGSYIISVEVSDKFGNVSTASETITIDTTLPEIEASLAAESDSGYLSTDNITNIKNPTLVGSTEPFATVVIQLDGGKEWEVQANENGQWTLELPQDLDLKDGKHQYTVTATDIAGNKQSEQFEFIIDTKIELSASLNNATDKDGIYVTNQNKLVFAGTSEAGSTITLVIADKTYTSTVKEDGSWEIVLDEPLDDLNYNYTITASDVAGNKTELMGSVSINTKGPVVAIELDDNSDSGVHDDWITNSQKPTININVPEDCDIKVTVDGHPYEPILSDDGKWQVNFNQELSEGSHNILVEVTDQFGNITTVEQELVIDTIAPDIDSGIDSAFDSGESNTDGITFNKKPMLTGTTEPNATVIITFEDGSIVNVTSNAEGKWSYAIPTELTDGTYIYSVEVSDAAGNTKKESFEFTVDTKISLTAKLDPSFVMSNTSNDYSTNSIRPNLSGQTDPGAKVIIECGGKRYETVADENGKWVLTLTTNATVGENSFTVIATDAAGNTTSTDSKFVYVPDGVVPPYVTVQLDSDSDSGIKGDNITSNNRPTLIGNTNPGLTVVINIGGQTFSTKADDDGKWSFAFNTDLPEGLNEYTVTVVDPTTGLSSTASSGVIIDTASPDINISLDADRDSGVKGDFITFFGRPTFSGKTEPNCKITFVCNGYKMETTSDSQGNWHVIWGEPLGSEGQLHQYTFNVTVTDIAGNVTNKDFTLVVDKQGPMVQLDGLTDESDTGVDDSHNVVNGRRVEYTTDLTPTVDGRAEPNSTIEILFNNKKFATVRVDENGYWSYTFPQGYFRDNGKAQLVEFGVVGIDAAGNRGPKSYFDLYVHKKYQLSTSCELSRDTDTDEIGDMVTTNHRPTFQGTVNLGGTGSITHGELRINGKVYSININKLSWSCSLPEDLPSGTHSYEVVIYDSWGNSTKTEGQITITNLSASLDAESDSASLGDNITNDNTIKLVGTCTEGAVVRVEIGGHIYDATVNNDGTWYVDVPQLTDNNYTYTVTETANGVTSSIQGQVTIDTSNTILTAQVQQTGSAPNTTKNGDPTLTGTAEAGAKISIVIGGKTFHTTANEHGNWTVTLTGANLASKEYTAIVTSTDKAGNVISNEIPVIVDREAPVFTYGSTQESLQGSGECFINSFTPTIIGKGEPGSTITVTVGNQVVSTTVQDDGTWNVQLASLSDQQALGEHHFDVKIEAVDKAGNHSVVNTQLVFDNVTNSNFELGLSQSSQTGDEPTLTNDKTPTLVGKAEAGATVTIVINQHKYTVTANNEGNWSYELPELNTGTHTVSVSYIDKAGNTSENQNFTFEVNAEPIYVTDTTQTNNGSNHYKGTSHTLTGTATPGAKVEVIINGEKYSAQVTPEGAWNLPLTDLGDNNYHYTIIATDKFGNTNQHSGSFVIDNQAPETTCTLATDSGIHGDNITNIQKPIFTGITEPGAKVSFTINKHTYETTADEQGRWQITVEHPLSETTHSYQVSVVDKAGNSIAAPVEGEVTVSTSNSQTISSVNVANGIENTAGDIVTNSKSPMLQGSAPQNAKVIVTISGNKYEALANEDGQWTLSIPGPLADNKYEYSVQVIDKVGNLGAPTNGSFVVDTTAQISIGGVVHPEESLVAANVTNSSTPTLSGTAEPGATVEVLINGVTYHAQVADNGSWTVEITNTLPDKTHTYIVTTTDKVGNTTEVIGTVTVDTSKPLVNEAGLSSESETGYVGSNLTNLTRPTFTGVTEPNAIVTLKVGDETFTFTAESDGQWSFTLPAGKELQDNNYKYEVTVTDPAGNQCETVVTGSITVCATPPSADVTLQAATNTGGKDDFVTANKTPTLCGKTTVGSIVVVTIENKEHLATVDVNGSWSFVVPTELSEGDHNFTVTVIDPAGNTNVKHGEIKIDLTNPTLTDVQINDIPSVDSNSDHKFDNILTNNLKPIFTGKSEPFATVNLTIGGYLYSATADAEGEWRVEVHRALENAEHSYILETIDQAGNKSSMEGSLTVDNEVTQTDIDHALSVGMDKVHLQGVVDSDVVSVKVTIDNTEYNASVKGDIWSVEIDETLFNHNDKYTIEVTDAAGNTVVTNGTFDKEINTPEVEHHIWFGEEQTQIIGSSDQDVTEIKVIVNTQEYIADVENGKWSVNIPQDQFSGAHSYTITAIDKTGNVSSTTVQIENIESSGSTESTTMTQINQYNDTYHNIEFDSDLEEQHI